MATTILGGEGGVGPTERSGVGSLGVLLHHAMADISPSLPP